MSNITIIIILYIITIFLAFFIISYFDEKMFGKNGCDAMCNALLSAIWPFCVAMIIIISPFHYIDKLARNLAKDKKLKISDNVINNKNK